MVGVAASDGDQTDAESHTYKPPESMGTEPLTREMRISLQEHRSLLRVVLNLKSIHYCVAAYA
jgi:hypothetical protein